MSKITINNIAEIAGVAKSTVSRYLNGGKVSEETKAKLKKVIEENNYQPNAFAQSLKAKRTKFIGVVAPCLDSMVTSRVLMAIDDRLREKEYNSLILNTSLKKELEIEKLENLVRLKVDGIILVATEITKKHKDIIKRLNIPILIVGQHCENANSIINDDYNAGSKIGEYIALHNHKKILYMGVTESDIAVGVQRKKGVLDKLKENGVIEIREAITEFSADSSEKIAVDILKEYNPTAIICATDKIALGACRAIVKLGKKVKDDISVVGFGGYDMCNIGSMELTTIRFNNDEVGKISADTIIKMTEGEPVPIMQVIGFRFLEGNSVKSI
ncbi:MULTISPECIES: LacI family DNA-binding transcriptional regulator [unclassified Clostridium]|uniref:LacI family DNA-binding transcriptional regulator n=1 Tax=unclassified Clostridium TaxID=2614128 RepID=UPI000297D1E9|nr:MULTISPECIES: LacI family DNA-binding transcriptional regulator [unclassified Clostridium]EKQ54392.1 MAG: transcriptional regulator [Clostridium sp. Maddingley MBC34-26]